MLGPGRVFGGDPSTPGRVARLLREGAALSEAMGWHRLLSSFFFRREQATSPLHICLLVCALAPVTLATWQVHGVYRTEERLRGAPHSTGHLVVPFIVTIAVGLAQLYNSVLPFKTRR